MAAVAFFSGSTSSQNFPYTTAPYRPTGSQPVSTHQAWLLLLLQCSNSHPTTSSTWDLPGTDPSSYESSLLLHRSMAARSAGSGAGCRRTSDTGLIESLFAVVVVAARHSILLAYPNYLTLFSPVWRPKRLLCRRRCEDFAFVIFCFRLLRLVFDFALFPSKWSLVSGGRHRRREKPES